MIKTGKSIQEAFQKTVYSITQSKESLHAFLKQNTYLYKYPMNDILSIHSQNKEATYVASFDIWNKYGRIIKAKARSIRTLTDISNENSKKNYYFDISQTLGKPIDIYNWTLSSEELPVLLAENHGDQTIHKDIYSYAQQMIDEMKVDGTEIAYDQLVALLTENTLLQKFDLPQEETFIRIYEEVENMNPVDFINTVKASNVVVHYTLNRLKEKHKEIIESRNKEEVSLVVESSNAVEELSVNEPEEIINEYTQEELFSLEALEELNVPENTISNTQKNQPTGFHFPNNELYGQTKREKINDNVEAIRLVRKLETEKRTPSQEEKIVLSKYVGWGGLSEVFDYRKENDSYKTIREELQQLVTEEEYEQMEESVLTAYYTDPVIIEQIYKKVQDMGFQAGNVLDPAMGTGNFFSAMPQQLKDNVSLTGIEIDSITGKIASYLHDDATVFIQPFQDVQLKEKSFDLIVGNIPFDNFEIKDKKMFKKGMQIHDYFISKSLKLLKDDGILAVISSSGTLDKQANEIRGPWAKQADLLGAIRLPNNAFKRIAGTEVVTDILFFKKPKNEEELANTAMPEWVFTNSVVVNNESVVMNRYFNENKHLVLGELDVKNFRGKTMTVIPNKKVALQNQLEEALSQLPNSLDNRLMDVEENSVKEINSEIIENEQAELSISDVEIIDVADIEVDDVPNFSFVMIDNQLFFKETEGLINQDTLSQKKKDRIEGMIKYRDQLRRVIAYQQKPNYEQEMFDQHLRLLNERYDDFVKKYGYLHDRTNENLFKADDSLQLLLSTEIKQEDGSYVKADIFREATIVPKIEVTHVDTAHDALYQSLAKYEEVRLEYMSELCGKPKNEIIKELQGAIFIDLEVYDEEIEPKWVTREEYLSGDVVSKLETAQVFKEQFPENVEALKTVQPKRIGLKDIDIKLGSPIIPREYYKAFAQEIFETRPYYFNYDIIQFDYNPITQAYFIKGKRSDISPVTMKKYGTSRANAYKILEDSLNMKITEVRDRVEDSDGNVRYELNQKETLLAREKQALIQSTFSNWIASSPERSELVVQRYNDRFNRYVPRQYDGSFLEVNGLNKNYELRPHQKNAVLRTLIEKRALYGHVVGSGKTLTMITSSMLLKEKGFVNKPMHVVPNHLTAEYAQELLRFFPDKKVLATTKKDFEKNNRKNFISKIATGNYDAIIIGQTQFEKISLSKEFQARKLKEEIDAITEAIDRQKQSNDDSWSFKDMKRMQKRLKERLTNLVNGKEKDELLTFEELGVDFLFVDEAHYYKNLFNYTKLSNVAGVNNSNSQRAMDMYMKVQYIYENNDNTGVVFATGTPISNSMSELYTMQKYLQPDVLEKSGIYSFDDWANMFGEITSTMEITPEGSGYRVKNRFAKFHNVPELMTAFSMIADIQTADMLDLPVPNIKGGKPNIVLTYPTEKQQEMMEEFSVRAEQIRNGLVDPSNDNMLKLTHEAKLMSLDMRLLDESFSEADSSKVQACVQNVFNIYQETTNKRSTQMIFCDSGTPKKDHFNVYDEIKDQLVKKGVPKEEIAFIHDAKNEKQRELLFEKVRNGQVRVLLGSTNKVGTGTNVQNKLIAAHHLDCPWRPSDLTQRDGRIVRQGNENKEVSIHYYVTEGTFDAYLWQIQEQKLRYITQIMNNKSISRSCDDLDETVLSAAEVKAIATNNPLIAEKMTIDNEVTKLRILKTSWQEQQSTINKALNEELPQREKQLKLEVANITKDMDRIKDETTDEFQFTTDTLTFTDKKQAGEYIHEQVKVLNNPTIKEITVGKYHGFDVTIRKSSLATYSLYLEGNHSYGTSLSLTSPIGTIQRMENIDPERQLKNRENELDELAHQKEQYKAQHNQPFEQEEKLTQLLEKQAKINIALSPEIDKEKEVQNKEKVKQQKMLRNEYDFDR